MTPTPIPEFIKVEFVSLALLLFQAFSVFLALFIFYNLFKAVAKLFFEHEREDNYSLPYADDLFDDQSPNRERRKDIMPAIEKALAERASHSQKVKCPYCGQGNLPNALTCDKCGGSL